MRLTRGLGFDVSMLYQLTITLVISYDSFCICINRDEIIRISEVSNCFLFRSKARILFAG